MKKKAEVYNTSSKSQNSSAAEPAAVKAAPIKIQDSISHFNSDFELFTIRSSGNKNLRPLSSYEEHTKKISKGVERHKKKAIFNSLKRYLAYFFLPFYIILIRIPFLILELAVRGIIYLLKNFSKTLLFFKPYFNSFLNIFFNLFKTLKSFYFKIIEKTNEFFIIINNKINKLLFFYKKIQMIGQFFYKKFKYVSDIFDAWIERQTAQIKRVLLFLTTPLRKVKEYLKKRKLQQAVKETKKFRFFEIKKKFSFVSALWQKSTKKMETCFQALFSFSANFFTVPKNIFLSFWRKRPALPKIAWRFKTPLFFRTLPAHFLVGFSKSFHWLGASFRSSLMMLSFSPSNLIYPWREWAKEKLVNILKIRENFSKIKNPVNFNSLRWEKKVVEVCTDYTLLVASPVARGLLTLNSIIDTALFNFAVITLWMHTLVAETLQTVPAYADEIKWLRIEA